MTISNTNKYQGEQFGRHAKMVCTLGPSTNHYEGIKGLALRGMNVARLNFSHGDHSVHQNNIDLVRKVSEELDRPIAILQDLQGPKIRVGEFEKEQIPLEDGKIITLSYAPRGTIAPSNPEDQQCYVSYPSFHKDVYAGDEILLDDGLLSLEVIEVDGEKVRCTVQKGGALKNKKGLNLPGRALSIDILTKKDLEDLEFGLNAGVDWIALSFVQSPNDIAYIKDLIRAKGKETPVVAKIEKPQAVEQIEDIIEVTDAVMVARGDLGVEIPTEKVPSVQKKIISLCNTKGVPVITATQMLESMIVNPRPTRAEASDVANAVLDGSDAVMLSGETASGEYPFEAVQTMADIIRHTEEVKRATDGGTPMQVDVNSIPRAICNAACRTAPQIDAKAIACFTVSGTTATALAQFRPNRPIIVVSRDPAMARRLALIWGVIPVSSDNIKGKNLEEWIPSLVDYLRHKNKVEVGDKLIITTGAPYETVTHTNSFRIVTV
jgi:pyruvate kinase